MILLCRTALGCAAETQERPREAHHTNAPSDSKASSAPLPDTAFQEDPSSSSSGDEQASSSNARPSSRTVRTQTELRQHTRDPESRFATRSIGGGSGSDGAAAASRFHGAPVDLDLKSADVHDVFRLLADVGKVNIVVAGEVSGSVTMRLRHVPWDQAMDVIARARGLAYEREGNVILVRPAPAPAAK